MNPLMAFFISFFFNISFLAFLFDSYGFSLSAEFPILYVVNFSTRGFHILILLVLNFLCVSSFFCVISESGFDDRVVSGVWYFLLVCRVPCHILLKVSALCRTVVGSPVILVPGNRLAFLLWTLGVVGGGVFLSRGRAGLWLPLCIWFAAGLFLVSVPASALGFPFGPLFRASVLKASQ